MYMINIVRNPTFACSLLTYILSEEPFRFGVRFRENGFERDLLILAFLCELIH